MAAYARHLRALLWKELLVVFCLLFVGLSLVLFDHAVEEA